jgi:hypothetical protein
MAATGFVGLVFAAAILAIAISATLLIALLTELGRIYGSRAMGQHTASSRVLWIALAAFSALLLASGLLAANASTAVLALYLAAWSFLAFVIVVEACDWYAQRFDEPTAVEEAPGEIWPHETETVSSNGHHLEEPIPAARW